MHRPVQQYTLHTDASGVGWGATLATLKHSQLAVFSGTWPTELLLLHSNEKELLAVHYALERAALSNGLVQVYTDNTSVVAVLNRQGTVHSFSLQRLSYLLFEMLQASQLQVRAAHIPGVLNLQADILSRPNKIYSTEWSLDQAVFRWLCATFNFSPKIDVFATSANTQLPMYYSPVPDAQATGLDAFNQNWDGWPIYVFPPFALYAQVIQKLAATSNCTALLVYPNQPRKPWYPMLLSLPHAQPVRLPMRRALLHQPHSQAVHPRLALLDLHATLFSVV
jgi:ribonuclease HI